MLPIYLEMKRCIQNGLRGVLGTIIRTEGSTYQKSGAKCFWSEDGTLTGLLSGGCVEGDFMEHAKEVLKSASCKTISYDFRGGGDDLWGLGLGCNGSIDIFLEPFDTLGDPEKAARSMDICETALAHEVGIATIVEASDPVLIGEKWVSEQVPFHQSRAGVYSIPYGEKEALVFSETLTPPPQLVIFGAGPDAVPLIKGAKQLNWQVTVIDHRPAFVNQQYFPEADHLICVSKGEWPDLRIGSFSFVVIMTHHFEQDALFLKQSLKTAAPYIGVLGPNKRTYQLLDQMNVGLTQEQLSRLHSPIGLDIGSKTPEEIALSILAEITMIYREKGSGNPLHVMKETSFTKYMEKKVGELAL
ncbi:Xanthine and CO dehydrogenase maturation factor, XdhC/CoxF family [Fictibacillus solisalsi]|uniref:Xanthine and CO dehydrogenase maturation factor, XdhC/CoxF family n=1 Tax=Fictibacillus solisalsi TaxID=459525 RepID=A0A1G9YNJ6_9BACL|nr:XdhC/CoxI family protein [Fictibacillus solisalsi]SDN10033.1 Xanthine and CO dehydrogenase maturation factor, XdhC/CoxF family [Fictibacillus solisalsi]